MENLVMTSLLVTKFLNYELLTNDIVLHDNTILFSGGGYHKPSALHSTDPIRVAKDSSECLFSESARTQPQKLMGQL